MRTGAPASPCFKIAIGCDSVKEGKLIYYGLGNRPDWVELDAIGFEAPGGWGGIRTHEGLAPLPVFKTGAFNRSATHPIPAGFGLGRSACASLNVRCRWQLTLASPEEARLRERPHKTGAFNRSATHPIPATKSSGGLRS